MTGSSRRKFTVVWLVWGTIVHGQAPPEEHQPGPMDKVLLKDYRPDVSLVAPVTHVPRAKYAAIDAHSSPFADTPQAVTEWVKTMDEVGIELTVIQTGATGGRFDRMVELFLKPYPNRFQLYCGIDTTNPEAADYPQRAATELERCYRKGARGVGEVSDKGPGLTAGVLRPRNGRLHVDDPRLVLFWRKCADLKIPVHLHIADHPSAWMPPDERQERPPEFQRYNQWGKDVPSHEELLGKRDRLLTRNPETRFIVCHLSNQGHDLGSLAKVLDRFPNMYLDMSARAYEVGRQPRTVAKFLSRYQDRVLFGTDQGTDKTMYQAWWRLFETADEFMPGPSWWRHYGLELPGEVLRKLYRENAKRLLNWDLEPTGEAVR